ncbi:protein Iojap-related, mitochondrial-like [Zingiber officinale]|uniref:protein Iojap-related, mitochondrial-like n=1 Tax=Zingiber officinale TaxID=94328 RepID=UPI001C4AABDD|nr:protein Iojap-related, mitochondrial-like [Zingiber officinale]
MLAALRSRALASSSGHPLLHHHGPWKLLEFLRPMSSSSSSSSSYSRKPSLLELEEIEKILGEVKADDVRVIPVRNQCDWTDFMVVATGRSTWHVRNIAQALIHKIKQKQKNAERLMLPSVQGHGGGKWIVIDSGSIIIHALEEKARTYYNIEHLWTTEMIPGGPNQDLENSLVKIRRRNKSMKPMKSVE